MTCKFCGYDNPESAKYCGKCGCKLEPKKKKHGKSAPIVLAVLAILIVLIIAIVFILKGNAETPPVPEQKEITKQLSQIRYYDESEQLRTEIDFTYEQQKVTHIKVKSFDEFGLKSGEQEYPIDYDSAGRVIRYGVQGLGRYEEYEYDDNGVLIRHGSGEGGYADTFYEYDTQGRLEESLTSGEDADYVSHYVYDNSDKCTRRDDYSYYDATYYEDRTYDLEVYHYKYDELGNLTEISGDSTDTAYEYDNLGRKASEVIKDEYGFIYTTLYCYDYAGLTICDINYNNNDDFNKGYCTAEFRDPNGFLIYSYSFDTGSTLSANEAGFLSSIEEPTGERTEFLYMESE